ncbi:MAG: hypothetical protein NZ992_05145 [Candidatus Korarchaeum sp.]|nr:hypothetical protein [Candidatus Korarchaeum sp.]MDW8035869.1 hypothetical protein [Candidatus Korarchaeum sp.]
MDSLRAYKLDLLYKWSSGLGFILTPKSKIKWEENYLADLKSVPEGENYLLVTLVYSVDERGRVVDTGYSLASNVRISEVMDELKGLLKTSWVDYPDPPDSLNYRIAGILSIFTKIKEWRFSEGS